MSDKVDEALDNLYPEGYQPTLGDLLSDAMKQDNSAYGSITRLWPHIAPYVKPINMGEILGEESEGVGDQ